MLFVKVSSDNLHMFIECDAGLASNVIYELSNLYEKVDYKNDICIICCDMQKINDINVKLKPFKNDIKLDQSFINWKNSGGGKSPLLIRCYPVKSKIFKSSDFSVPHADIENVTKYFFEPAVNQKKFKDGKWDGYINLYKRWLHEFPTGLLDRVEAVLKEKNIPYRIEWMYDTSPAPQFEWKAKELFTLSEDQVECIESCVQHKRCVVKAATGFGKTSALARYLTVNYSVPTLFIANKKVLLDDAANDFINGIDGLEEDDIAKIKDGWFGMTKINKDTEKDDILPITQPIVIATIQSLSSRLKDERTKDILLDWLKNTCKFVLVDETQAVGSTVWDDVLSLIMAPYRVFLSATPKRVDGATLKIFAYAGSLAYDTNAAEQISKGRLCEMNIEYHVFDHKLYNDNDKDLEYQNIYQECIVDNPNRNKFIVDKTLSMVEEERQVLVLVQFIEHGHILKEVFMQNGIEPSEIRFIWGDTPDKLRKEAIDGFRKNQFKILIGSTIADTGLNIPSISGVVLAGAGNSDITHIQRIGRGARTFDYKKNFGYEPSFIKENNGEKTTNVIDILDTNVAFFKKQSKNRYYNAVEEFGKDRVHLVNTDSSIFRMRSKPTQSLKDINAEKELKDMFAVFTNIEKEDVEKTYDANKAVDDFLSGWNKNEK